MMDEKDKSLYDEDHTLKLNHATTEEVDYGVVRFDGKEFKFKVSKKQRFHKDYAEMPSIEISQTPSREDESRVRELLEEAGLI